MAHVLAVVAYPALDEQDRRAIEEIRSLRDPQARRIAAHFTLVFPIQAPLEEVEAEIAAAAAETPPIAFTVRRVEAAEGHVFLVADEGRDEIARLHDRLYAGVLRPHLRTDLPYVPHITVAANPDAAEHTLTLGVIRGTITHLDLVDVSPPRVRTIERYALSGAKP